MNVANAPGPVAPMLALAVVPRRPSIAFDSQPRLAVSPKPVHQWRTSPTGPHESIATLAARRIQPPTPHSHWGINE